jgi:hypothetical protein
MPAVALTVLVFFILIDAVSNWVSITELSGWRPLLFFLGIDIGRSFVAAPLLIAIHRYVLLGDVTRRYTFLPIARYLRFVGYAVIFEVLLTIPLESIPLPEPGKVSSLATDQSLASNLATKVIVSFTLAFIALCIALCMVVLFPAIAVEVRGASWQAAMRQSIRHIWRLLFTIIGVTLSLVIGALALGLSLWAAFPNMPAALPPLANSFLIGAMTVFSCAVYAAMASRLYWSVQRSG